jgi:hypothetical protein
MPTVAPSLINDLCSEDELARIIAAEEIRSEGSTAALRIVHAWRQHREVAALLPDPERHVTVGLAVHPATFRKIHIAVGAPELASVPPDQDAMEFELSFDNGVLLDILTTKDPAGAGALARYLHKFGEGVQQIEFLCKDVDLLTELLKTRFALTPIYPATRAGANHTRINFFLVSEDGKSGREKILLEIFEKPSIYSPH